jgi:hypothetical protein
MIESGPRGDRTHNPRIKRRLALCQGMPAGAAEVQFLQDIGDMSAGECRNSPPRFGAFLPITFPA